MNGVSLFCFGGILLFCCLAYFQSAICSIDVEISETSANKHSTSQLSQNSAEIPQEVDQTHHKEDTSPQDSGLAPDPPPDEKQAPVLTKDRESNSPASPEHVSHTQQSTEDSDAASKTYENHSESPKVETQESPPAPTLDESSAATPSGEEIPTFKEFQRKLEEEQSKQRLIRQQQLNVAKVHDTSTKLPTLPMKGAAGMSKGGSSPNAQPTKQDAEDETGGRVASPAAASSEKDAIVSSTSRDSASGSVPSSSAAQQQTSAKGHVNVENDASSSSSGHSHDGGESGGQLPSVIERSNGHKRVITPPSDDEGKKVASPKPEDSGKEGGEFRERMPHVHVASEEKPPPLEASAKSTASTDTPQLVSDAKRADPEVSNSGGPGQDQSHAQQTPSEVPPANKMPPESASKDTVVTSPEPSGISVQTKKEPPTKTPLHAPHPKTNVASRSCGAKLLEVSDSMENSQALLNNNPDEYMNQPCAGEKWFVLETCEAVQVRTIQIANFEFFSSRLKTFHVYTSDRYPVKQWELLGVFQALNEKGAQSFDVTDDKFVKYLKFEFLDHYGTEHYCPMSMVGVYGTLSEYIEDEHLTGNTATHSDEQGGKDTDVVEKVKQTESEETPAPSDIVLPEVETTLPNITEKTGLEESNETLSTEEEAVVDSVSSSEDRNVTASEVSGKNEASGNTLQSEGTRTDTQQPSEHSSGNETESQQQSVGEPVNVPDATKVETSGRQHLQEGSSVPEHQTKDTSDGEKKKEAVDHARTSESGNGEKKVTIVEPSRVESGASEGLLKKAKDLIINVAAGFQRKSSSPSSTTIPEVPTPVATPKAEDELSPFVETPFICPQVYNLSDLAPLWPRLVTCVHLLTTYHRQHPPLHHPTVTSSSAKSTDVLDLPAHFLTLSPLSAHALCHYVRVMKGWNVTQFLCLLAHVQRLQRRNVTILPLEDGVELDVMLGLDLEGLKKIQNASSSSPSSSSHGSRPATSSSSTSSPTPPTSSSTASSGKVVSKSSPTSTVNGGGGGGSSPPPSSQQQQQLPPLKKDIIYMRLSNRMGALEQKVNVSMNYLEELSQSHRRQMERQTRSFNHTLVKLTETARAAEERDHRQHQRIAQLERQLRELRSRLRPNALYHHLQQENQLQSSTTSDSSTRGTQQEECPRPAADKAAVSLGSSQCWIGSESWWVTALSGGAWWMLLVLSGWAVPLLVHIGLAVGVQLVVFYCVLLPRLRGLVPTSAAPPLCNGHHSPIEKHKDNSSEPPQSMGSPGGSDGGSPLVVKLESFPWGEPGRTPFARQTKRESLPQVGANYPGNGTSGPVSKTYSLTALSLEEGEREHTPSPTPYHKPADDYFGIKKKRNRKKK